MRPERIAYKPAGVVPQIPNIVYGQLQDAENEPKTIYLVTEEAELRSKAYTRDCRSFWGNYGRQNCVHGP